MTEEFIINLLKKASESYYNTGDFYAVSDEEHEILYDNGIYDLEINDEIYDKLYDIAKSKYFTNQFFNKVGSDFEDEYGKEIVFDTPNGSMTELKSGDWYKWKIYNQEYIITHKLDGCSIILYYENGHLIKAASRGDGYKGKDITRHVMLMNVPKTINYSNNIQIRGECICPIKDISNMILELKDETGREYKNGRNTISGFLNSKNTLKSVVKYAHFVAFSNSLYNQYNDNKEQDLEFMKSLGFEIPIYHKIICSNDINDEFLETYVKEAKNSNYECDGIVIDLNHHIMNYEGFELGTINPKYARKFKIGATNNSCEAVVTDIKWEISKDGYFKPVVEIEPVELVGVTVSRATGHNYKNIIDNHIGVGSRIIIKRSGDVIPYIEKVLTYSDNYRLPPVPTVVDGVELRLSSLNIACAYTNEMNIKKILAFALAFKIDYMGYANCKKFYEYYKNPIDLLFVSKNEFEELFGVNGIKIYDSIHKNLQNTTESKLFGALGTFGRGISISILEKVEERYHTLDITNEQANLVEGFGDIRIQQFLEHKPEYYKQKQEFLKQYSFNQINNIALKSNKFSKYNVCFTGVRSKELTNIIKENGGQASDSWNKNINLLIAKDPNSGSGKIKQAIAKGIKVISLDDAIKLFNEEPDDIF